MEEYAGANTLNGTEMGNGGVNNNGDYETDGAIESTQIIVAGTVDYDSGVSVELKNGFEVTGSAEVDVFIDGCNDGAGGNTLKSDETLAHRQAQAIKSSGMSRQHKEKIQ